MPRKPYAPRICDYSRCRQVFTPRWPHQRFHKPACRMAAWAEDHPRLNPRHEDIKRDLYLFKKPMTSAQRLTALVEAARRVLK